MYFAILFKILSAYYVYTLRKKLVHGFIFKSVGGSNAVGECKTQYGYGIQANFVGKNPRLPRILLQLR